MLKDIVASCPFCHEQTPMAVSVPVPGESTQVHGAHTSCRRCMRRLLAITEFDGTVRLASEEGELLDTLHGVFGLTEVMRIPFALWQPRGHIASLEFNHRPDWAQALQEALKRAVDEPRPLSVPRRIFLSYRWQGDAKDKWVDELRRELDARGNAVVLDRQLTSASVPPTVPEIVARIAGCHIFLSVLDPPYLERVSASESVPQADGWVTDEYHTALAFARQGTVLLLGMLREGDLLPPGFRAFATGSAGNVFDVREPDALKRVLNQYFVQFGEPPSEPDAARAAAALHASRQAFDAGDANLALSLARQVCDTVPQLADGHAQCARVANAAGQTALVLAEAQRAFAIDPTLDEMLIKGAAAALDIDMPKLAASQARLAIERNESDATARYLLGHAVGQMGHLHASLAHFEESRHRGLRAPQLYNRAGEIHRMLGQPAQALPWYEAALELWPTDPNLLVNACAAALEAGKQTLATGLLLTLTTHHEKLPAAGQLAEILVQQIMDDDLAPPILIQRVARPAPCSIVTCSACALRLPVFQVEPFLCAGCGVPWVAGLDVMHHCACCDADGRALPSQHMRCPFCDRGELDLKNTVRGIAAAGGTPVE